MGTCFSKRNKEFHHSSSNVNSSQDYLDSKNSKVVVDKQDAHFGQHYQSALNSKIKQRNSKLLPVVVQAQCQKQSYSASVYNINEKDNPVNIRASKYSNFQLQNLSIYSVVERVDVNNPEFNGKTSSIPQLDEKSLYGIKNLSQKWISQIRKSSITPEEIRTNPRAFIDIITAFQAEISYQQSALPQKLLTSLEYANHIQGVQFINQNPNEKWSFTQQLGRGYDCKVFKAIQKVSKNQTPRVFAVRIFQLTQTRITIQNIKKQIAAIKLCSSRNIIDYEFSYLYQKSVYMFVNYMNGGSITYFLKNQKNPLTEELIAYLLKQILIGLKAIHKNHQIHRDIKSDNILINQFAQIKITDFAHAIQLTPNNNSPKQAVGTPAWMAPQLIKRQVYNQSVDIWSLGILSLQLALGQPPYLKMNQLKAMYEILSKPPPKLPDNFSQQFRKFVGNCLQKNPQDRLNVDQLLQTPFIKSINQGIKQKIKLKALVKQYCEKK